MTNLGTTSGQPYKHTALTILKNNAKGDKAPDSVLLAQLQKEFPDRKISKKIFRFLRFHLATGLLVTLDAKDKEIPHKALTIGRFDAEETAAGEEDEEDATVSTPAKAPKTVKTKVKKEEPKTSKTKAKAKKAAAASAPFVADDEE